MRMAVQINLGAVVQDAGKAVEDYRSPRRSAFQGGFQTAQRLGVLQPSGAYSPADVAGESLGANVKLKCYTGRDSAPRSPSPSAASGGGKAGLSHVRSALPGGGAPARRADQPPFLSKG